MEADRGRATAEGAAGMGKGCDCQAELTVGIIVRFEDLESDKYISILCNIRLLGATTMAIRPEHARLDLRSQHRACP